MTSQGRVKVVGQAAELGRCHQGRAAARSRRGRAIRHTAPPDHSELGGGRVLILQAGSHRATPGASPAPTGGNHRRSDRAFPTLTRPWMTSRPPRVGPLFHRDAPTCMVSARHLRRSGRPGGPSVDATAQIWRRIAVSLRRHPRSSTGLSDDFARALHGHRQAHYPRKRKTQMTPDREH